VRLRLDEPLQLGSKPSATEVHGQIALLANRWVGGVYPQMLSPTCYGVYDLDFSPFGFDPRNRGHVPLALAGTGARDSVTVVLEPGPNQQSVVLRGVLAGDSVAGHWILEEFRGGATGRFVMRRQRS
jgi:hypothetical protein